LYTEIFVHLLDTLYGIINQCTEMNKIKKITCKNLGTVW